jgi:hypothetical protein
MSPTLTRKGRVALCKHDEYCTTSTCALQHPRREARKKTSDRRPFCSHDEFCTKFCESFVFFSFSIGQTQQHRIQYQHGLKKKKVELKKKKNQKKKRGLLLKHTRLLSESCPMDICQPPKDICQLHKDILDIILKVT